MSKTSPYDVKIQNVVASVTLDQKINLLDIMKIFRNVEYRPKQFPGLVFRLKKPVDLLAEASSAEAAGLLLSIRTV